MANVGLSCSMDKVELGSAIVGNIALIAGLVVPEIFKKKREGVPLLQILTMAAYLMSACGAAFIASSDGTIYLRERDPRQVRSLFSTSHALFSSYQEKHWKSKMELININIEGHEGVISFYFKEAEDVRKSKILTTTKALIIRMNCMSYFYFPDIRELLEWNILIYHVNWMHRCFKSEHDLKGRFPCSIKGVVYNKGENFVLKFIEVESCENRVNSLTSSMGSNHIEKPALIIFLLLLVVASLVVVVFLWHHCWKVPKSVGAENEIIGDEGGDGEGMSKDEIVVGEGECIVEDEDSTNDIVEFVTAANEIVESVPRKKISLEEIIYNEEYFKSFMKSVVDDYNGNIGSTHGKIYLSEREIAQGQNGTLVLEGLYISHNHAIHVAVKRFKRDDYYKSLQCKMSMSIPSHKNIHQCYDSEEDEEFVYLALERCTHNLNELISCMYLTGERLVQAIRDIIIGLMHLHEHGYVHGHLKPENILFIFTRNVISARISLGSGDGRKNSGWCAPELINEEDITQINVEDITQKSDMFILGCLIYFWITEGWHPFGWDEGGIRNTIKNNWDRRLLIQFPTALHLVSVLLEHEKKNRLDAKGALNHPYFWDLHKKSEFLREVHHWCKTKVPTTVELHVIQCLRNIESRVFHNYNWAKSLSASLAFYLQQGKLAKYAYDNILDLIRAYRNLISHRKDLPPSVVKELKGDLQTDIYQYFETRFPNLLIEVFQVMYRECRQENTFIMYFSD